VRAAVLAVASVVLAAGPAAAHGLGPTDTRSTIVALAPAVPGLSVRILGADAGVELRVPAGAVVEVPGYEGEPFLRFADGRIERNERSPAVYLDRDRYAAVTLPADADAAAPPRWVQVADGRTYAWHDHRAHWMGIEPPPAPVGWTLPLRVDGAIVEVRGVVAAVPVPTSVPWWLALAAIAVLGALVLRPRPWVAAAVAVAAVPFPLAVALAAARSPVGRVDPGDLAPIAAALVALCAALAAWRRRGWRAVLAALVAGAGTVLVVWGWAQRGVLDHALGPLDAPWWVERTGVVATAAAGVALVALGARAVLALPPGTAEPARTTTPLSLDPGAP
jgi:hypothetical protein